VERRLKCRQGNKLLRGANAVRPLEVDRGPRRTSFERFELKYWVPDRVAREVVRFASPYLRVDPFSGESVLGQYNTSLYLDTPQLDFYDRHLDSNPDRFKLRVRGYGSPPSGTVFFEVKRKVRSVIVKRRAGVPMDWVRPLLDGTYTSLPPLDESARVALESFLYLQMVHRATPKFLIQCRREAYLSTNAAEDIRLTVDRDIVYQPAFAPELAVERREWVHIDTEREHGHKESRVLLELKFCDAAPLWMEELVQRLALFRDGYSKYMSAAAYENGARREDLDFVMRPVRVTGVIAS
jgi:hypothetical protein